MSELAVSARVRDRFDRVVTIVESLPVRQFCQTGLRMTNIMIWKTSRRALLRGLQQSLGPFANETSSQLGRHRCRLFLLLCCEGPLAFA